MFNTNITNFENSTTPFTKRFLTCGDCGVGSVGISTINKALQAVIFPIGAIVDYHAPNITNISQIPEGWALCDGESYDRNDYPALYSVLGVERLPNLIGKINTMKDQTTFGLLSDLGEPANELGKEIGVYEELMTLDTLPAHAHVYNDTRRFGGFQFANESNDNGRAMLPEDQFISNTQQTDSFGVTPTTPITNRQPTITTLKLIKIT